MLYTIYTFGENRYQHLDSSFVLFYPLLGFYPSRITTIGTLLFLKTNDICSLMACDGWTN